MHKSSKKLLGQDPEITQRVEDCTKKIVEFIDPEKIIVFGSFARGEVSKDKTIDFMIIAKTELSFFDRIKGVLEACKGAKPSIEPLVYTPQEFDLLLGQGEGFLEDALEEGIVVYDKG